MIRKTEISSDGNRTGNILSFNNLEIGFESGKSGVSFFRLLLGSAEQVNS